MEVLASVIWVVSRILILAVIVHVFLGYFLDRYHPIRQALGSFIEPVLDRIRPILPDTGAFDFSPLILILIIELIARALSGLLT